MSPLDVCYLDVIIYVRFDCLWVCVVCVCAVIFIDIQRSPCGRNRTSNDQVLLIKSESVNETHTFWTHLVSTLRAYPRWWAPRLGITHTSIDYKMMCPRLSGCHKSSDYRPRTMMTLSSKSFLLFRVWYISFPYFPTPNLTRGKWCALTHTLFLFFFLGNSIKWIVGPNDIVK